MTAGDGVAYAWALLRCRTEDEFRKDPDNRLRLTSDCEGTADAGSCPTSITRSRTRASEVTGWPDAEPRTTGGEQR